jgi:hypothetical protein
MSPSPSKSMMMPGFSSSLSATVDSLRTMVRVSVSGS